MGVLFLFRGRYGRWGYDFLCGAYGNGEEDHARAQELLCSLELSAVQKDSKPGCGLVRRCR